MPATMLDADVIGVGGGLAGLACALGLAGARLSVTVLERAGRLGGRAASFVDDTTGDVVDTGPHIVHNHCHNLLAFARWVGTDAQIVWQEVPLLTVADGDHAVDIRNAPLVPPLHLAPSMLAAPGLTLRCIARRRRWRRCWACRPRQRAKTGSQKGLAGMRIAVSTSSV